MMRAIQFRALLGCVMVVVASQADAAMPLVEASDHLTDGEITLAYEPSNGVMLIEANGQQITTFELKSEAGVLTGVTPDLVLPPFDVHTPNKFFILKTEGIGDTNLGPIAGTGYGRELGDDLTLTGSVLPNGALGNPNLCFCLPEPSSWNLALISLLGCLTLRRREQ